MMNRLLACSALILALAATTLGNVPDVRFATGKSALNIPFKIFNNHIYLHVRVNDGKPLWFLLDTGASNIINHRHAQALGLKLNKAGQTIGVGEGVADYFLVDNVSFNLPGATVRNQKFAVISLENVEECLTKLDVDSSGQITPRKQAREKGEQPIDGVLGFGFFKLFVVEIDYVTKTINLHDPDNYRYQGDGEKIPFEIRGAHIFARAKITAGNHSALDGLFLIDSGSATGVVLNSPFVVENNLLPPADQTVPFPICGIGGESQTQLGKISAIQLGTMRVENAVTMFSQAQNGELAKTDYNGQVGNATLRRFKIVFDYSRKVMILERVKDTN
jgi:hypothetical protein